MNLLSIFSIEEEICRRFFMPYPSNLLLTLKMDLLNNFKRQFSHCGGGPKIKQKIKKKVDKSWR